MSALTARRWAVSVYAPDEDGGREHAEAQAKALLRDLIRDEGYVFDPDTLEAGTATPMVLDDHAPGGFRLVDEHQRCDGRIVEFSAGATERLRDDDAVLSARREPDGTVSVPVPASHTATGGGLRVQHELGGPVAVTAYRPDGQPMGYLFATPIDEDTEHVELLAGTGFLSVELDPESEDTEA